jgi:predicted  nucleic acid-binding Zn-ribbon protein
MDFRDYAAKETSELAARLTQAATALADEAAQHVRDEAQQVADALRGELHDARSHAESLQGDLRAANERIEAISRELADTERARDEQSNGRVAAEADLSRTREDAEALRRELQDARAHAERVEGELRTAAQRIEAATRQLDEARKASEKLEATRNELSAARDEQANARRAAETDLRQARETIESLRGEIASAMKTLEKAAAERLASEEAAAEANSQSQAAEVKLTAVTDLLKKSGAKVKTLEKQQLELEQQIHDLEARVRTAQPAAAAATGSAPILDDLLTGFQALAGAGTISEVLTTLVEQMAAQFPRVALFRVKKGHLQGEHQIGFDLQTDIGKLVLPLGMDSLPSRAASSGQIEALSGGELEKSRMPFSGSPTHALALPMVVGGETLAVVYADDSGASKRARGGGAEQIHARYVAAMQQYAVAVLMRLNNELKTLAELRKYAISLLVEIEQMYNADVESGTPEADLHKRLAGNLDYARSIYGSRTALESADAATLFDEELGALIESRGDSPFAHDLGAAAGGPPQAAEAAS